MNGKTPIVELRGSPHLRKAPSVDQIMRNVVYALLPLCAFAVYQFGLSALALILATTLACVGTEHLFCRLSEKPTTVGDFSAVITGLLLALTLPPGFPLWMAVVAGFVGIALTKVMFGGIGFNVFNPALVGRAFVQAAFPVAITTWTPAFAPGRFTEFIPTTWTLPFLEPESVAGRSVRICCPSWADGRRVKHRSMHCRGGFAPRTAAGRVSDGRPTVIRDKPENRGQQASVSTPVIAHGTGDMPPSHQAGGPPVQATMAVLALPSQTANSAEGAQAATSAAI